MREEVTRILKMVEEGKITAEQAIQLMEAGNLAVEEDYEGRSGKARWLRVRVYESSTNRRKINISVPLSLVSVGLKLGMKFGLDRDELKGFDFNEIIRLIETGEEGKIVDVFDEDRGEKVEIYVE